MEDEQNGHREITSTNDDTLFFFSKERICNLTVVPAQGRIEYWNGSAFPNHWDSTNHLVEPVVDLPRESKVETLGLELLGHFGIRRTDLAQDQHGHLITFGEKQTRGYYDRRSKKFVNDEVIARGIYFNRRIDGVNFAGIGLGGGCEVQFSNHGKVSRFDLVWRNLVPYEHYRLANVNEIRQFIMGGKALLTHKNEVNPSDVKSLIITEISPLYMGAAKDESQDYVYPFAKLEATANTGETNVDIELYCPILSTNIVSK